MEGGKVGVEGGRFREDGEAEERVGEGKVRGGLEGGMEEVF